MGEAELIQAAASGDAGAFERLVALKRRLVLRAAYRMIGNLDDAQDVAQTVFLTLWNSLDRYDPNRRFDTWLYRVTVNAAIDMIRKRGPETGLQAVRSEPAVESRSVASAAADRLDRLELSRAFRKLAARLPERQRAAFVLRELQGMSTAEVAEVLGVAESTVRNHLHQARKALREGIVRDYPGLAPSGAGRSEEDPE